MKSGDEVDGKLEGKGGRVLLPGEERKVERIKYFFKRTLFS